MYSPVPVCPIVAKDQMDGPVPVCSIVAEDQMDGPVPVCSIVAEDQMYSPVPVCSIVAEDQMYSPVPVCSIVAKDQMALVVEYLVKLRPTLDAGFLRPEAFTGGGDAGRYPPLTPILLHMVIGLPGYRPQGNILGIFKNVFHQFFSRYIGWIKRVGVLEKNVL